MHGMEAGLAALFAGDRDLPLVTAHVVDELGEKDGGLNAGIDTSPVLLDLDLGHSHLNFSYPNFFPQDSFRILSYCYISLILTLYEYVKIPRLLWILGVLRMSRFLPNQLSENPRIEKISDF